MNLTSPTKSAPPMLVDDDEGKQADQSNKARTELNVDQREILTVEATPKGARQCLSVESSS